MSRPAIAVLISGGGTTLKNLLSYHQRGLLPVRFELVVSTRASARGLTYAQQASISTEIVARKMFQSAEAHSQHMFGLFRDRDIELVVMGGYLDHLLIPDDYQHRVINIHPSLIPAFSGKGFYGNRVHQAAIDFGVKLSGCTVHFVDNQFDHGPIIAQRSCPVHIDDTAERLQTRVFELECRLYPEVIRGIAEDRVHIDGRQVNFAKASD